MVKKIKVVEMNTGNPEAAVEQQEADPTPMQEDIPQPESPKDVIIPIPQAEVLEEPNAKKPRQPRQPREPKPPKEQKLVREPRQKKVQEPPPSESDSINTEEMIEVNKNHRASKKQPAAQPCGAQAEAAPPPPSPPVAKEEEKATCPHCHKVMSAKSLKYAHAKNCRAQPPAKDEESRADFMLKAIEADKNKQIAKAVEHPISVLLAAERAMRMGQRRERIESLLSNAF